MKLAEQNPGKAVVFFGVGFETTAPATAMAVYQAARKELKNFFLLASHVLVPPAMEAILRSPDHAVEISTYARAVGSVFRKMATTRQFSPVYLIDEANKATAGLQTTAPPEIIDAKNAAIALYKIFYGDQLMVAIPEDKWAMAISQLFWESIDQALKDAGQPGVN